MQVNTAIIGVAGAGRKTGCTHLCLIMANFLKNKGYSVALLEKNVTHVFRDIMDAEELNEGMDGYFYLNGLDFYMTKNETTLPLIISRPYDYLIIDYGEYADCDRALFSTNAIKIITCGSKPWELTGINAIFKSTPEEILQGFHYCFQFARDNLELQREIMQGMDDLTNVYFLPYTEDPFTDDNFPEAAEIVGIEKEAEANATKKKRGIFGIKAKGKNNSAKNEAAAKISIPPTLKIEEPKEYVEKEEINEIENIHHEEVSKFGFLSKITSSKKEKEEITLEYEEDEDASFNISGISEKVVKTLQTVISIKEKSTIDDFTNYYIKKSYQYAFCLALRSGSLIAKRNGEDEAPIMVISVEGQEITMEEESVKNIIGVESFDKIIKPYIDSYRKVTI